MDSGNNGPDDNRPLPGDANGKTVSPRNKRSFRSKRGRGGMAGKPEQGGAHLKSRGDSGESGGQPVIGVSAATGSPSRPVRNDIGGNRAKRRGKRKSAGQPDAPRAYGASATQGVGVPERRQADAPRDVSASEIAGADRAEHPARLPAPSRGPKDDHPKGQDPKDRDPQGNRPPDHDSRRNGAPSDVVRSRSPRRGGYAGPLYAALDLGTNNCRLLVARPDGRGFRVVDAYSRIVRLGEGVAATNRLSEAAMQRAVEALTICRDKLAECGQVQTRLIATEACRSAENGSIFIERVREETGLALEIVNRKTEARLAVAGCTSLVDLEADGVLLFDIGGGSSELVWLDLRNRCGARGYALTRFMRAWTSLPLGVVTLAERHGGTHVGPEKFEAMVADVTGHLGSFGVGPRLAEAIATGKMHMLGTSGTVTTLAGVHLELERYDRRRVDGTWMQAEQVSAMIDQLRAMTYEERVNNPCIGADRADLVLAGCAILEAIRRRWPCPRLRVADRGLREGILTELMAADRKRKRRPPRRRRNSE